VSWVEDSNDESQFWESIPFCDPNGGIHNLLMEKHRLSVTKFVVRIVDNFEENFFGGFEGLYFGARISTDAVHILILSSF
jgi:hypothetical protein